MSSPGSPSNNLYNAYPLTQISIISICNFVTNLSKLVVSSPPQLPWALILKILPLYPATRWSYINRIAKHDDESRCNTYLGFMHLSKTFTIASRNAVLTTTDWLDHFDVMTYCIWVNVYLVKDFNIRICKKCYNNFKQCTKHFNIINDHYHAICDKQQLSILYYHNMAFWCQSCFSEVLFEIYEQDHCLELLHANHPYGVKRRFKDPYESDSDDDDDDYLL